MDLGEVVCPPVAVLLVFVIVFNLDNGFGVVVVFAVVLRARASFPPLGSVGREDWEEGRGRV